MMAAIVALGAAACGGEDRIGPSTSGGGGPTTSSTSTSTSTSTGGGGSATAEGRAATALASAGGRSTSNGHTLMSAMGEPVGASAVASSSKYTLRGGVIAAATGKP